MTSNSEASTGAGASAPALIDIGANLCAEAFRHDLPAVLERAREARVETMIVTGSSVADSESAQQLASEHPGVLFATAGIHPHLAREWSSDSYGRLKALTAAENVVAVGEAGLDFNRDFSPRSIQEKVFEAHIELAVETAMPLFVHERDAHERLMRILAPRRADLPRAVVHCFTGSEAELEAYLELDLYIGITGWICDERRGLHLRKLVGRIPEDRLMIETDAPYLLPRDLSPKPKSRRNEPCHLPHILGTVAECRGTAPEVLARVTVDNARRFFDLPQSPVAATPPPAFAQGTGEPGSGDSRLHAGEQA